MSGTRRVPPTARLAEFPEAAVTEARWWEGHILEVLHGRAPDAPSGTALRPEYDPRRHSLSKREAAKAAELTATGHTVSASTVKHRRQRYQRDGLVGLVDGRAAKQMAAFGRVDPAVVDAMRQAIAEAVDASSRTIGFILWRTKQILTSQGYDPSALPSQRTLYRLFAKMSTGTHTVGSARTRRSVALQPEGPFGQIPASAPGELVQIDSTPLDVLIHLGDGIAEKVELTAMVDVASRSVSAAVLRPTTKAADASALLARSLVPEPMRPGWPEALSMARSVLPHRRLLDMDERLKHAAARPVIVPETIVCDHGKVFISQTFQASCRFLGINLQPAHKATPTDKGTIERTLGSMATLFAQFVSGYTGSTTDRRGRRLHERALWSLPELQELLDEWIVAIWQNRPHDALRDPDATSRALTPNEKYAALIEAAGYVPVRLAQEDFIELLPVRWQAINTYGIRINHRTYDSDGLTPLRRQHSGIARKKGRWEVHYDPYDISRIWVRDRRQGTWITAFWKHLHRVGAPFGEMAWDHARRQLPRGTEEQIADAATALLQRAHHGPAAKPPSATAPDRRDRRVAARTRATTPNPDQAPAAPKPHEPEDDGEVDAPLAEVIPLGLFDPLEDPWSRR